MTDKEIEDISFKKADELAKKAKDMLENFFIDSVKVNENEVNFPLVYMRFLSNLFCNFLIRIHESCESIDTLFLKICEMSMDLFQSYLNETDKSLN